MPLSASGGGGGIHADVADLPLSMPFDSVKHYEDYIARLHQIPQGLPPDRRRPPRRRQGPPRCRSSSSPKKSPGSATASSPPTPSSSRSRSFPPASPTPTRSASPTRSPATVNNEVFPAYKQFSAFITKDYIPYARTTLSVNSLGDGKRRYQATLRRFTTTDLTAAQIHEIGLKEVDRITAEMTALAKANGYKDLASFRDHIENDPKYQPLSAEAIVDDFRKYIAADGAAACPSSSTCCPKPPSPSSPSPPSRPPPPPTTRAERPTASAPAASPSPSPTPRNRSFINDEAVAYHEGVPGHHLQISIQQSLTGLPEFRKHGGNSAYTEGWGLYAEELGKEIGFYQDPGSDYGRLRSELFRAVRLVVDTGIHDMDWTRDQVVDYMRKSHAIDEPTIQAETDRYISGPGQACSYKLGQLKIRELRERAKQQLGPQLRPQDLPRRDPLRRRAPARRPRCPRQPLDPGPTPRHRQKLAQRIDSMPKHLPL